MGRHPYYGRVPGRPGGACRGLRRRIVRWTLLYLPTLGLVIALVELGVLRNPAYITTTVGGLLAVMWLDQPRTARRPPRARIRQKALRRAHRPVPTVNVQRPRALVAIAILGLLVLVVLWPGLRVRPPDGGDRPGPTTTVQVPGNGFKLLLGLARLARDRYGLQIKEFGPGPGSSYSQYGFDDRVDLVHVERSYHYRGRALDASGPAAQMSAFANTVKSNPKIIELFWCGFRPVNLKHGRQTSCGGGTGGHANHVHLAV